MKTESLDVQVMRSVNNCEHHIMSPGESLNLKDVRNRIFFNPMYAEEPDLQILFYQLKDCTIKSITRTFTGTGFQFHF